MAPPDGFKLTLLGVTGTGAQVAAPHDAAVATTVSPAVLKQLFQERLKTLLAMGILTAAQVAAFEQLISDVGTGHPPTMVRGTGSASPGLTAEGIIRTAILTRVPAAGTSTDSFLSFLADAFVTLGGGIYGAITEGSIDGFLQGASVAHQWAEDHIPDI